MYFLTYIWQEKRLFSLRLPSNIRNTEGTNLMKNHSQEIAISISILFNIGSIDEKIQTVLKPIDAKKTQLYLW